MVYVGPQRNETEEGGENLEAGKGECGHRQGMDEKIISNAVT